MHQPVRRRHNSLRLTAFDYKSAAAYFITICTHKRRCNLGQIEDFEFQFSKIGTTAKSWLLRIPGIFPNVELDEFAIMPNHVHAIIHVTGTGTSLSAIVSTYKSATTRQVRQCKLLLPNQPLWQRGYFDHVIRSEADLFRIRQYVMDNPIQWHLDELHPSNNL